MVPNIILKTSKIQYDFKLSLHLQSLIVTNTNFINKKNPKK